MRINKLDSAVITVFMVMMFLTIFVLGICGVLYLLKSFGVV